MKSLYLMVLCLAIALLFAGTGQADIAAKDLDQQSSADKDNEKGTNPGRKEQKFAIVIGVSEYNDGIPSLPSTSNDADAMAAILEKIGFDASNIVVLKEDENNEDLAPTRANIYYALLQLDTFVDENDTIFFYFSGQGKLEKEDTLLVPKDAVSLDSRALELTSVSLQDVVNFLEQTKAARKIILIDACGGKSAELITKSSTNSFQTTSRKEEAGDEETSLESTSQMITSKTLIGTEQFLACSYNELAFEWQGKENRGVFTKFFVEALNGQADLNGDHLITLSEAINYTSFHTSQYVQNKYNSSQRPHHCGNLGNLILVELPLNAASKAEQTPVEEPKPESQVTPAR